MPPRTVQVTERILAPARRRAVWREDDAAGIYQAAVVGQEAAFVLEPR
jgi:hypothetical protein